MEIKTNIELLNEISVKLGGKSDASVLVEGLNNIANALGDTDPDQMVTVSQALETILDHMDGGGGSSYADYLNTVFTTSSGIPNVDLDFEIKTGQFLGVCFLNGNHVKITGTVTEIPSNQSFSDYVKIFDLPTITKIGTSVGTGGSANTEVMYMPKVTTVGSNFFTGGITKASLVKVVIGNPAINTGNSYRNTPALKALVIPTETVQSLGNTSGFEKSGIYINADGYIYVPRSLVNSYKTATNWSNYASKFRAIEDYPLINAPTTWLPSEGN